ncbi:MAG: DUF3991 domain-containing protein, partial [Firmicutes bacterium]|nr:DUF3991 domain-containing protein [Bacillota bacterium]
MAEQNEQYPQTSGGNNLQGTDLQINNNEEKAVTENNGAAFSDYITTIETELYSEPDEHRRVKKIGMAKAEDVFDQLEAHLKKENLMPDEYLLLNRNQKGKEIPDDAEFIAHTNFGGSEGIYIDILMRSKNGLENFATAKTLGENHEDFIRMGRIAAECSLMLNGNGMRIERAKPKEKQLAYHISADGTQSVQIGHKSENTQVPKNDEETINNNTEKSKDGIIGNTVFKHIKKKTYHKDDTETAMRIAAEFDKADIKYSGKINDNDTVTLTYSGLDSEKVMPIIEAVKNAVKEERNKKGFTEEEIELARKVNLVDYLQSKGIQLKQVGREYTMPEHDSMRIRDNRFFWNSRNMGGNAVDFCMKYFGMDFTSSVGELLDFSGYRKINAEIKQNIAPETPKVQIEHKEAEEEHKPLPYSLDTKTNRVYAYLTKTRGIDADIVNRFIKDGSIGQDERGNAVFKTFDEQGNLSGAEINSTLSNSRFKQSTERNGNGFTIIPNPDVKPKSIIFFESAIDTLSYYNLAKRNNNRNIDNYMLVSMGGLKDKVINETLQKYEKQFGIKMECILSTDNDDAGINFAKKFDYKFHSVADTSAYKNHTGKKIKDWNDLLKAENERLSAEKETSETTNNEIKNVFQIADAEENKTRNEEITNNTVDTIVEEKETTIKNASDDPYSLENIIKH